MILRLDNLGGVGLERSLSSSRKPRIEAELPNDLVLYCARQGFGTEMHRAAEKLFAA
jgi:hypothetical protein